MTNRNGRVSLSNFVFVGVLITASIFFSGCSLVAQQASLSEQPVKVLTGTVVGANKKYSLMQDSGNIDLESRKIDLGAYQGKVVTVTGEYSGTTLFVDEVK